MKHLYEFGPFRADAVRGVLTRQGLAVELTGKCFEILVQLLRNAPATVSKDELMKAVWADTFVEESNLTQHISLLRKALGETPRERLYIATVPGTGYRFVASVREKVDEPTGDPASAEAGRDSGAGAGSAVVSRAADAAAEPIRKDDSSTGWNSKRWLTFAGVVTVLVAVAGYLSVRRVNRTHGLEAKDSVLLADFENGTGDPVFGGPLRQGIAIQLGQSPFLDLVGQEDVRETLQFMGRSPEEPVRLPLARELCERVGAKAVISGSLARLGSAYVIGLEAIGCGDGKVLDREQMEAENKEDVLRVMGKVAAKLRSSLGESLTSVQTFDVPMEQATTRSLAALQSYSLGVDERNRGREKTAIPFFEHAIALDPGFAMAYAQLGTDYKNLGQLEQARDRFKQAYALRENLSEREKLHLTVRYLETVTGDLGKAIETYELWSRMYPRDAQPLIGLSGRYQVIGQYEKAVAASLKAVSLTRNQYIPYENLARSYLALNRFDEAKQACQQAEKVGRDSLGTHRVLLYLAWIHHDALTMKRELEWARGTERENDMLASEADLLIASGKVKEGRQLLERSWAGSRTDGLAEDAAYSMAQQARTDADLGNLPLARSEAAAALQSGHGMDTEETAAEALALAGDVRRAEALVAELGQRFPLQPVLNHASLPSTLAAIELQRHSPENAVGILVQAVPYDFAEFSNLSPVYVRGLSYLQAHSGKEAASEFQKILDHPGIDASSDRHPLARLGMARAYALMGNAKESHKNYAAFFALWSNADTDIPVLRQARQEDENLGTL